MISRKDLIIAAARRVIVAQGLYDASIGKIAKAADIPVGSVYTYFDSKETLINHIYREDKLAMGACIFQPVPENLDVETELNIYWSRAVDFGLENPEKFAFTEQCANSPFVQTADILQVEQEFQRLFILFENGIQSGVLKNLDRFLLHAIVYNAVLGAIKYLRSIETKQVETVKNQLFACCWDSIKRN